MHFFDLGNAKEIANIKSHRIASDRIDIDTTTRDFNLWPIVEHNEIGEVAVDGNPVHFSDSDWNMNSGAPCLGEDNEKVFTEILGLSKEDIRSLKQENVI